MNMMKKFFFSMVCAGLAISASAQQAVELKQQNMAKWDIGGANYSGISPMGKNRYAMVSDKEPADGFYVFRIDQNMTDGRVVSMYLEGFYGNPNPQTDNMGMNVRDCEGVAYLPSTNTVFISGEGDQRILEYRMDGSLSGRRLLVPDVFASDKIVSNYGFEALTYSPETHTFWTTTESTLKKDGPCAGPQNPGALNLLRIQSFGENMLPKKQYAYRMDQGKKDDFGKTYVYGVSAMTALPNGKLLVMEREADVSYGEMSSQVICKIFMVDPNMSWQIDASTDLKRLDSNKFMVKTLIATFKTKMTPFKHNFANYEGMCLGEKLSDGRQTLLLVCDSQNNFGKGPVRLKDYIKVLILP